jgi:hypothetical protein
VFVGVSRVSVKTGQSTLLGVLYNIKNMSYAEVVAVHLSVCDLVSVPKPQDIF